MSELPGIDPAFAAEVVGNLPSRLAKKLADVDPSTWQIAEIDDTTQVTVGTATVTISGPQSASCDCLLAPRCLHLAGVLSTAPVADEAPAADTPAPPETPTGAPPTEPHRTAPRPTEAHLSDAQRGCVAQAADALTQVLEQGLTVVTAPVRAQILRVVALARAAGLHRLGASFAALHTAAASPTQRSVYQLRNAALAVQVLQHGDATGTLDEAALGTARRTYRDIGVQRLRGLAAEPVLTDSGYAGVVAHFLAEGTEQLWTVNALAPGELPDVRAAYRGSIDLGQLATPIADAVRAGLLLAPGTGSSDFRLGRGKTVRASLREPSQEPWPQLPGWWFGRARLDGMVDADPHPLLRLAGTDGFTPPPVVGLSGAAWQLDPHAFGLLVRLAGDEVDVVLRGEADAWTLLAIDSASWQVDRRPVFVGLDRLRRSATGSRAVHWELPEVDQEFMPATISPEAVLARWSARVALRGRRAVTGSVGELERDVRWLTEHASPHRAAVLDRLGAAARAGTTDFSGAFVADSRDLRSTWLAVAVG